MTEQVLVGFNYIVNEGKTLKYVIQILALFLCDLMKGTIAWLFKFLMLWKRVFKVEINLKNTQYNKKRHTYSLGIGSMIIYYI